MTKEQAIERLKTKTGILTLTVGGEKTIEMAIKALEEEPCEHEAIQFAKWVASEIFDDNWEYNKDAFDELACRKLAKLGIVRTKDDEWELIESQENEGAERGMTEETEEHFRKLNEYYDQKVKGKR